MALNPGYFKKYAALHQNELKIYRQRDERKKQQAAYYARPEIAARRRQQHAEWARAHPERMRAFRKNWKQRNPEKVVLCRQVKKKRERTDRDRVYERRRYALRKKSLNEKRRVRCRVDPCFKLRMALRIRLNKALRRSQKSGSAVSDLGCTITELRVYLESKFYPRPGTGESMTWENWSRAGWHIDHTQALASFDLTDREQLLRAVHYTNLQPLWAEENYSKGAKPSPR